MQQYLNTMRQILDTGVNKGDRTQTGTKSLFGVSAEYDLTDGKIPLLTTKKIYYDKLVHETLWFLSGDTNIKYLKENNVNIWDSWVIPETAVYSEAGFNKAQRLVSGSIGPAAYGALWRKWDDVRIVESTETKKYMERGYDVVVSTGKQTVVKRVIDQVQNAIDLIRSNPDSRRIIVTAWNPGTLEDAVLPPCHTLFQFWTRELSTEELLQGLDKQGKMGDFRFKFQERLSEDIKEHKDRTHLSAYAREYTKNNGFPVRALQTLLYCRSQDFPVGTPFNIAQYGLLTQMVAKVTNTLAERLFWVGGDTHIYYPQEELARNQLTREPLENQVHVTFKADLNAINDFTFEDITIEGYNDFHPAIKYSVAV